MRHVLLLPLILGTLLVYLAPSPHSGKRDREKRFVPEVRGKAWRDVVRWLSRSFDKEVIGANFPAGVCEAYTQPGRSYTAAEVIDLLNGDLLDERRPQPFFLIPRERSIGVIPHEERDEVRVPRLDAEEIVAMPRTVPMLASTVFVLKETDGESLAPQIKDLLSPLGHVCFLRTGNCLLVQDRVSNLCRIIARVRELDRCG